MRTLNNPYLVESWRSDDGSSWYRVYSDGFIEQGGNHIYTGSTAYTIINFPMPFRNIPAVCGATAYNGSDWGSNWSTPRDVAISSFKIYQVKNSRTNWHACGY